MTGPAVPTEINGVHLQLICQPGAGPQTCSYLLMHPGVGFMCGKGTSLETALIARREAGQMGAMGDNCAGWQLPAPQP